MGNVGEMHHTRHGRNSDRVAAPIPGHYRNGNLGGAGPRIPYPYP